MTPAALRRYIAGRRRRDAIFDDGLFYDPAWDILLDLYLAEMEDRLVSVSSACIAAAVASTTALRHISELCARGLLAREPDRRDRRRFFLRLTDTSRDMMRRWIAAVGSKAIDPVILADDASYPTGYHDELDDLRAIVDDIRRLFA